MNNVSCTANTWTLVSSFQFPENEELHNAFVEFGVRAISGSKDVNAVMRLSRTGAGSWSESTFYINANNMTRLTSASIIWIYENATYNIEIFSIDSQLNVDYILLRPFIFYRQ